MNLEKRVLKVLEEKNFILKDSDKELFSMRINNGRRYFFMVLDRLENDNIIVKRFLKIPVNNTKKLLLPFKRQIEIIDFLHENKIILTRRIIESRTNPKEGIPFAIMETLDSNQKIGFIEDNDKSHLLTKAHATKAIAALIKLHEVNPERLPPGIGPILKKYESEYKKLRLLIFRCLNKKVSPIDYPSDYFHKILGKRLGIENLKAKVIDKVRFLSQYIYSKENSLPSVLHGDMSPNNLYIYDSGDIEFLDLEWVGEIENRAMAMVIDYGNLRARSWDNAEFRKGLDEAVLKHYSSIGQENIGKAITELAILRSHILLSGFFENYKPERQNLSEQIERKNNTEKDIKILLEKNAADYSAARSATTNYGPRGTDSKAESTVPE